MSVEGPGTATSFDPAQTFTRMVQTSSRETWAEWREIIRRELRGDGLAFSVSAESDGVPRGGELSPLPWFFSGAEWQPLESGVAQRARLLDAIARDLLGPRQLITRGVLPAELLFADSRWLRPGIGLQPNFQHWLFHYGVDLLRGADGRFQVLADHTGAPSGDGYALENRTILGQVFPRRLDEMRVRRLAPYFRALRESMLSLYTGTAENPRVVLLTPGPYSPAYFEHAYLASYLGYTLVQGDDLLVREGALKLKTLEGLQPVDLLYRHMDAAFLDPLELRRDSMLGVPGLLGAVRSGGVAVLNHPGSGVLENPGLQAYMSVLCRELLSEELILPSVPTRWCGNPEDLSEVLGGLDRYIIKPILNKYGEAVVDGRQLSSAALEELRARIAHAPEGYVAQKPVAVGLVPGLSLADALVETPALLSCFAHASPDGYRVMPGGLGRSGPLTGGGPEQLLEQAESFRDVWVLGDSSETHRSLWLEQRSLQESQWFNGVFTSRAAENLFWVGRYAERLMQQSRCIRSILQIDEGGFGEELPLLTMSRTADLLEQFSGISGLKKDLPVQERVIHCLGDKNAAPGSVQGNLRALLMAAYSLRDIWSQDSWRLLMEIEPQLSRGTKALAQGRGGAEVFADLIHYLNAFHGLNSNSMTRESGWYMLMLGRTVESALGLCNLIGTLLDDGEPAGVDYGLMEQALQLNENLITYRRHYRTTPRLPAVLQLMVSTEMNPRSLLHYVQQSGECLRELPEPVPTNRLLPVLQSLDSLKLQLTTHNFEGRQSVFAQAGRVFEQVSEQVSSAYFSHTSLRARENF